MLRHHRFPTTRFSNSFVVPSLSGIVFSSSSIRQFSARSSTVLKFNINKNVLNLDDDEQDKLFQETLKKQQEMTSLNNKHQLEKTDLEIRREKTTQFLNIIVDVGIVQSQPNNQDTTTNSSSSSHYHLLPSSSDPKESLQLVQDMITAAVKQKTLNSNHIRRLFALCGNRQREDPSREMWIRMLSVIATVKEAERDLYFVEHDLYEDDDVVDGRKNLESNANTIKEKSDEANEQEHLLPPVIVTGDAWNALLGLSVDYVMSVRNRKQKLAAVSTNTNTNTSSQQQQQPQRSVLQSELELLLGAKQCEEPHWWILSKMDKEDVAVTNKNVIKFLASEVSVNVPSSLAAGNNKEEELAVVDEKTAKLLQASMKKNVLASRVEMVQKQFQNF